MTYELLVKTYISDKFEISADFERVKLEGWLSEFERNAIIGIAIPPHSQPRRPKSAMS